MQDKIPADAISLAEATRLIGVSDTTIYRWARYNYFQVRTYNGLKYMKRSLITKIKLAREAKGEEWFKFLQPEPADLFAYEGTQMTFSKAPQEDHSTKLFKIAKELKAAGSPHAGAVALIAAELM